MTTDLPRSQQNKRSGVFWAGCALALLVSCWVFPRLDDLPTRGEETRWATVAREMVQSHDWIVPRQQGEPFLSRPPAGPWLIALVGLFRGDIDLVAIRLPTAFATLATALGVFWISTRWLSTTGAFLVGLAFVFNLQVIQLTRVAETDIVFTALLAGSIIGWHHAWSSPCPRWIPWIVGYSLAALAALAKGPQAPTYFVGTTWLLLLIEGHWKSLFRWSHLLGLVLFAMIMAAWHVPFQHVVGWEGVFAIWSGDVKLRWVNVTVFSWAFHLVEFPLEVLAGLLPWSLALIFLADSKIRAALWSLPIARLSLVALLVSFPTCWLTPNARVRYFLPMFPHLAIVIGSILELALRYQPTRVGRLVGTLTRWQSWGTIALAIMILVTTSVHWQLGPYSALRFSDACLAVAVLLILAFVLGNVHPNPPRRMVQWCAITLAIGLALVDNFVRIPMSIVRGIDTARHVDELRKVHSLAGVPSIGAVHHRFAYFYRESIPVLSAQQAKQLPVGSLFFYTPQSLIAPPFAFDTLETISCDRNVKSMGPIDYVIVGRRRSEATAVGARHETHNVNR